MLFCRACIFAHGEIVKSFYNAGMEPPLYYYRDSNQKEIDLIIEYDRTLYPVEIKQTASPNKKMAAAFKLPILLSTISFAITTPS